MESVALSENATAQPEPPQAGALLPDEPLVVIKPSDSWLNLGLRHIWAYRELLYFLIWRDVKVRYKQTVLGILWVVLQPLLTTLILTVFLGKFARVPSDGLPYPLFVFA
ncbi:MAG: ABC transporter permease, partial [Pyrinomonadaceae bacterium]